MSITSDIRSYADAALEQGKHAVGQAQTQLSDATGQANDFVGKVADTAKGVAGTAKGFGDTAKDNVSGFTAKLTGSATDAVSDLRAQAEKAVNLDALKTAVEPYLAQAKHYSASVTDRAEGIFESVKNDKRVGKVITTAESLTGVVVATVNERVVQPVVSLTGRGSKATVQKPVRKPATKKPAAKSAAAKPATTRPATKKSATTTTTSKATGAKSTTRKAPAKKATPAS